MIDEKLCGTFWLVQIGKKKYITQGEKPKRIGDDCWVYTEKNSYWLCVEGGSSRYSRAIFDGKTVTSEDYSKVNFPDVPKGEAVEIEIVKSGRVYTYES